MYVGIGFSLISPNLSFEEEYFIIVSAPYTPKVYTGNRVYLQFSGYHLYIGIPIAKSLFIEPKIIYVPKDQIVYRSYWQSMMFQLSTKYNINLNRK